jgi:hypothetical protein
MPLMQMTSLYKQLLIGVITILVVGCDGGFHVLARVVDSDGQPIKGAKALATSKAAISFDAISDARGCLRLDGVVKSGNYDFAVVVDAPSYKTLKFASPTLRKHNYQLVLAKNEQAFNSQPQVISDDRLETLCGGI